MRLWKRLETDERCGQCGGQILRGQSICFLMLPNVKRPLLRCEKCIGPAPEDDPIATLERDLEEIHRDEPPIDKPAPPRRPLKLVTPDWLLDHEEFNK